MFHVKHSVSRVTCVNGGIRSIDHTFYTSVMIGDARSASIKREGILGTERSAWGFKICVEESHHMTVYGDEYHGRE